MVQISVTSIPGGILLDNNNGNASSNKNEKVQWNPGHKIERIEIDVEKKDGDIDIWSTSPGQLGKSKNWQGTTGNKAGKEHYSVKWWKPDGTHGIHDPVISVRPT